MRRIPRTDRTLSLTLLALVCLIPLGCGDGGPPDNMGADGGGADAAPVPSELTDFLATVDGLTFTEQASPFEGYRFFFLEYDQPVDHQNPTGKRFTQRARLLHKERARPMVLYTSGYQIFSDESYSEVTFYLDGNQLQTEQRFFADSTPTPHDPADWQHLTIEQAAADHHRFVTALAPFYNGSWVSTGHSKGGMTSIYHRRFYPDDVDATVAYVAPISFGAPDTRYYSFFTGVLPQGCHEAIRAFEVEALNRRAAMESRTAQIANAEGLTFDSVGGLEAAVEGNIAGFEWGFWQYYGIDYCADVPPTSATDDALFNFLVTFGGLGLDDARLAMFRTYYYQAEHQLGYPDSPSDNVDDLLLYQDAVVDWLPTGVTEPTYDPSVMADVDGWVQNESSRILFVYGEYDPWSGGMFELGSAADSSLVVAAQATHGAYVSDLTATDQAAVFAALERWTGVTIGQASSARALSRPPREAPVRVYLPPSGMRR